MTNNKANYQYALETQKNDENDLFRIHLISMTFEEKANICIIHAEKSNMNILYNHSDC
jgi:hypothetical protein